jgi:hypothetical protein
LALKQWRELGQLGGMPAYQQAMLAVNKPPSGNVAVAVNQLKTHHTESC